MVRSPCSCCRYDGGVKKGPWTEEEDSALLEHIRRQGGRVGSWRGLPNAAGLNRCGKSCRLRWNNYLRPDIKRGNFTDDEERPIISLHSVLGNKWSTIATHLEGRTDNEIKNYWNTHIRKKLLRMGVDPATHQQLPPDLVASLSIPPEPLLWAAAAAGLGSLDNDLRQVQLLQQLLQAVVISSPNNHVGASNLINNLAAANAMFYPTASISSVMPNLQDQLMSIQSPASYQLPGYLLNTSSFPEHDVVQQLINTPAAPAVSFCPAAAPPTEQQHCGSAAAFVPAASHDQLDVAVAPVDRPALPEYFPSLVPTEMPDLCAVESDPFWEDMLEDSQFHSY